MDGGYLPLLGAGTQTGRGFTMDETREAGSPRLAVVSHAFWTIVGAATRASSDARLDPAYVPESKSRDSDQDTVPELQLIDVPLAPVSATDPATVPPATGTDSGNTPSSTASPPNDTRLPVSSFGTGEAVLCAVPATLPITLVPVRGGTGGPSPRRTRITTVLMPSVGRPTHSDPSSVTLTGVYTRLPTPEPPNPGQPV